MYRDRSRYESTPPKLVRDVDFSSVTLDNHYRAGIVPYCNLKGIRFYCFGVEDGVGALADFGGQVDPADNDLLDTAIREFSEETLNVFGELTRESLQDCQCFITNSTLEIFYEVNPTMSIYNGKFDLKIKQNTTEVVRFVWLSRNQVYNYIAQSKLKTKGGNMYHMYDKIAHLFREYQDYI